MNRRGGIKAYKKAIREYLLFKMVELLGVRLDYFRIMRSIRTPSFKKIIKQYKDYDPYPGYSKYLNVKPWMLDNIWRARILGLHLAEGKNILDIGTGNGYFPYVCRYYGHQVRAIDIDSNPIFNALIKELGVSRLNYSVKPFESIPEFDIKFDLVTAFHIYFNGHRTENLWSYKEWNYFLMDIANRLGKPDMEAYFILNQEHDTQAYYTEELKQFFESKGAEIDNDRVYFKTLKAFTYKLTD